MPHTAHVPRFDHIWCSDPRAVFEQFEQCIPASFCADLPEICKTVSRITYTVLVETLNPAQSINQST